MQLLKSKKNCEFPCVFKIIMIDNIKFQVLILFLAFSLGSMIPLFSQEMTYKEYGKVAYLPIDRKQVKADRFIPKSAFYSNSFYIPKKNEIVSYQFEFLLQELHQLNGQFKKDQKVSVVLNTRKFAFKQEPASELASYIVFDSAQHIRFNPANQVVHIHYFEDSDQLFIESSRYVQDPRTGDSILAKAHIYHYTRYASKDSIKYDNFYSGAGTNITATLFAEVKPTKYSLFINGYRGSKFDADRSKGFVYSMDRTNYWMKTDQKIDELIPNNTRIYMDGHASVKTSVHRSKIHFAYSYLRIKSSKGKEKKALKYQLLNQRENSSGYRKRRIQGSQGAAALDVFLHRNHPLYTAHDTIEVFAHSMGVAYSEGLLENMNPALYYRSYYLLSPEGYKSCVIPQQKFDYVWQFGSNLGEADSDPLWEQDGIAPQGKIAHLETSAKLQFARYFIPKDWPSKNFIDSHMLYNYDWILPYIH